MERSAGIATIARAAQRLLAAPGTVEKLRSLPIRRAKQSAQGWAWLALPPWAADLVPKGKSGLFVPAQANAKDWASYDWWAGAQALLLSEYERAFEAKQGPIHSYSFRLDANCRPAFDHAWVNRIVLFLRRWWSIEHGIAEEAVFGPVPPAIVHLSHDVDAVEKTLPIRLKQAAFCLYNRRLQAGARFLLGGGDYWQFDTIDELEKRFERRSLWNFYGGRGGWRRPPKEILMDPAYCTASPSLQQRIKRLAADGHNVGLHPKFATWNDPQAMRVEKENVEAALGRQIDSVRQHWLRFSFQSTWQAQKSVGLTHDLTLGFNDRSGFRNSAAFSFIDSNSQMRVTPMVLMDSHLFDYATLDPEIRFAAIDRILDELVQTGGEASVIWHQRVFHSDYDWGGAYAYLLEGMRHRRMMDARAGS